MLVVPFTENLLQILIIKSEICLKYLEFRGANSFFYIIMVCKISQIVMWLTYHILNYRLSPEMLIVRGQVENTKNIDKTFFDNICFIFKCLSFAN